MTFELGGKETNGMTHIPITVLQQHRTSGTGIQLKLERSSEVGRGQHRSTSEKRLGRVKSMVVLRIPHKRNHRTTQPGKRSDYYREVLTEAAIVTCHA